MDIISEMNLPDDTQICKERELYLKMKIAAEVEPVPYDEEALSARASFQWLEYKSNLPQNLFFVEFDKITFVGRKLISTLKLAGKLKELNCSGITIDMFLGKLHSYNESQDQISIKFHPLLDGEKKFLFSKIARDPQSDFKFPFKYLDPNTGFERKSPANGWSLNPMRARNLGIGELHLRQQSIKFLSQFDLNGKTVYDPSCSTCEFLSTMKQNFPGIRTIGQDLSQQMIDYGKTFVDEAYCLNALLPPIPGDFADFIFIRFLNSEVVSSEEAFIFLEQIIPRCRKNGRLIVFGHTPVLLTKADFEKLNLRILQSSAYDESRNIIFQYYVLEKCN